MTAEAIAKALGERKAGGGWTARCPAHDDRTPSSPIRDADDKKVLVRMPRRVRPRARHRGAARARSVGREWPPRSLSRMARRTLIDPQAPITTTPSVRKAHSSSGNTPSRHTGTPVETYLALAQHLPCRPRTRCAFMPV